VALGCAALVQATALWCSAAGLAVTAALFTAVLAAIYRSSPDRAFWAGFAVFGWGYLILVYGPILRIERPDSSAGESLVSIEPIDALYELIHGTQPDDGMRLPSGGGMRGRGGGFFAVPDDASPELPGEQNPFVDPSAPPFVPPPPPLAAPMDESIRYAHFSIIANLLFAMVFALAGGVISRALYATRERRDSSSD
jgi:hypothetical protein